MQIKNARNSGILIAALTSAFALSACGASNTPAQPAQVVSQPNDSAPASGQAPATPTPLSVAAPTSLDKIRSALIEAGASVRSSALVGSHATRYTVPR